MSGGGQVGVYSFRAEAQVDVGAFLVEASEQAISFGSMTVVQSVGDGYYVEFETTGGDPGVEYVRAVMRGVQDGHVMRQTLRPCSGEDNSFERDGDA